ncbi:recombinase family protein [Klebsiella pneumoniae]|jgi:DNA invertase Pin-like site-specific DNA recombinase|uniref:recombinase family protein n=1 Tax=Shewanella sp. 8A TaxID=2943323 RepID=UPI00201AA88C|nr:recombinase family protein [Shewanella sp. 8A]
MIFGYCRISTKGQSFDLQEDALKNAGCERVFKDVASGAKTKRPGLDDLLGQLRAGDIIVVYKLDRLGRSLQHLVHLMNQLTERQIGLRSLNDPVDTTTPQGRLITNVFASIAEFERDLIRERTKAGLASARARGRNGGRPPGLSKEAQNVAIAAEALYKQGSLSAQQIAAQLSISKTTLYKYLRLQGVGIGSVGLR